MICETSLKAGMCDLLIKQQQFTSYTIGRCRILHI